ncbi:hypothetical protein [Spirosoma endophyticum]|uniref:Uncharacterized protein n=1 Tax=Spirosoma endophyticum TaxID=662367 RepID=A0A1I2GAH0_9BACT|nr:hypothetical protein [Spirosoma endophyticum]SFF14502.1 hypothetical protein SAMN05216167_1312 [Spirosoma endophyticum]
MLLLFLVACLFFIYKIFDDDKVLYSQNHSKEFFDGAGVQAAFCATAILVVLEYLNIFVFKIPNDKFRLLLRYTLYLISPILFVIIINSVTTTNIKKGLAEYDVVFKYDGKQIQTDTNIVYIGATQNYLFLRERMTRKNYIYKIDKIDNLSMKKISYELGWIDWRK